MPLFHRAVDHAEPYVTFVTQHSLRMAMEVQIFGTNTGQREGDLWETLNLKQDVIGF